MRHPHKYGRALKITFSFTYLLDATAAVVGLLMFGDDVMDASKWIEQEFSSMSNLDGHGINFMGFSPESPCVVAVQISFFALKTKKSSLTEC